MILLWIPKVVRFGGCLCKAPRASGRLRTSPHLSLLKISHGRDHRGLFFSFFLFFFFFFKVRLFSFVLDCKYASTNDKMKSRTGKAIGSYEDLLTEKTHTQVVRAHHMIIWIGQDYPTGNNLRRGTKRQTMLGRQHQRVDWP